MGVEHGWEFERRADAAPDRVEAEHRRRRVEDRQNGPPPGSVLRHRHELVAMIFGGQGRQASPQHAALGRGIDVFDAPAYRYAGRHPRSRSPRRTRRCASAARTRPAACRPRRSAPHRDRKSRSWVPPHDLRRQDMDEVPPRRIKLIEGQAAVDLAREPGRIGIRDLEREAGGGAEAGSAAP